MVLCWAGFCLYLPRRSIGVFLEKTDVPKTARRVHVFGCQRYPHGPLLARLAYLIMADLEQRPLLLLLLRLESMVMMFSKKNLMKPLLHVQRLLLLPVLRLDLDFFQGFWMMTNLLLRCHRNIGMNLIVRVLRGRHGVDVMRAS